LILIELHINLISPFFLPLLICLDTSVSLVQLAGLVDTLNGAGPFVVFAPTDAAFNRLPPTLIQTLKKTSNPANLNLLQLILKYHVVVGQPPANGYTDRQQITTVAGENVTVFSTGDGLLRTINYAEVLSFEPVRCQNGVIYLVDNALFPSGLAPVLPTSPPYTPTMNAVDTLKADARFSTLGLYFLYLNFY
jgi:hypothetical protein